MQSFQGKYVLITGASSGIGEALALAFAQQKAQLVLAARRSDKLEALKVKCLQLTDSCQVVSLDLSMDESVEAAAAAVKQMVPHLDVLVNNAGISQRATAAETDYRVERQIMQTNFLGPVYFTKLLQGHFLPQQGAIVVISSVVGLFGFPLRSSYAASKHALHGYFESMAMECQYPFIMLVCPGRINTPISLSALQGGAQAHGQIDPGQANGIPADECANRILRGLSQKKNLLLIARGEKLLWYIRRLSPALFRIISKKVSAV